MTSGSVFVSYAHADAAFVTELVERLETKGVGTYLDRNLPPGSSWSNRLEEAIRTSTAVIVVVSKASISSRSVLRELHFADREGKAIIPVMLEPAPLPLIIADLQYVDGHAQGAINAVVRTVKQMTTKDESLAHEIPYARSFRTRSERLAAFLLSRVQADPRHSWVSAIEISDGTGIAPRNLADDLRRLEQHLEQRGHIEYPGYDGPVIMVRRDPTSARYDQLTSVGAGAARSMLSLSPLIGSSTAQP